MKAHVAVVSTRRADNVPEMSDFLVGHQATWYVGHGEEDSYREAGAEDVVESGGLCESRNAALMAAAAKGLYCCQISDDMKGLSEALSKKESRPLQLSKVLSVMIDKLDSGATLVGIAPTSNLFYFNPDRREQQGGFCVGDLFAADPSFERFDENLKLKEDYDFGMSHSTHGLVVRLNWVMAGFRHRSNPGGAVDVRTTGLEQESIAYLFAKWPGQFRPNPRRENEILLQRPKVSDYRKT